MTNIQEILDRASDLRQRGDLKSSLSLYKKIIAQDGRNFEALLNAGEIALIIGADIALELFTAALLVQPHHPAALVGRAACYLRASLDTPALKDIDNALLRDDPQSEIHLDCLALLCDYGYVDRANALVDGLIEPWLSHPDALLERAYLAVLSGDRQRAADLVDMFRTHCDNDALADLIEAAATNNHALFFASVARDEDLAFRAEKLRETMFGET